MAMSAGTQILSRLSYPPAVYLGSGDLNINPQACIAS